MVTEGYIRGFRDSYRAYGGYMRRLEGHIIRSADYIRRLSVIFFSHLLTLWTPVVFFAIPSFFNVVNSTRNSH